MVQLFDLMRKVKVAHQELDNIQFWKWYADGSLALVTDKSVLHWNLQNTLDSAGKTPAPEPKPVFKRLKAGPSVQFTHYEVSSDGKFALLCGLAPNPDANSKLKTSGVLQVHSFAAKASQPLLPSHAACFVSLSLPDRKDRSTLLCFTRPSGDSHMLNVLELGVPPSKRWKKSISLPSSSLAEFPVALTPDAHQPLLYILTKAGNLTVYDILKHNVVYSSKVAKVSMIRSCAHSRGGVVTVDLKGVVRHIFVPAPTPGGPDDEKTGAASSERVSANASAREPRSEPQQGAAVSSNGAAVDSKSQPAQEERKNPPDESAFALSAPQAARYMQYVPQFSTDGFADVGKLRAAMSLLNDEQFKHVWTICDEDGDDQLNARECCLAMHVYRIHRSENVPLPEQLPQCLRRKTAPKPSGYPLELFADDVSVEDKCCGVCGQVAREVVESPCGHIFCERCIAWVAQSAQSQKLDPPAPKGTFLCPMDQQHRFTLADVHPNQFLRRTIINLPVRCSNHDDGCTEADLTLDGLGEHLQNHCLYAVVGCALCQKFRAQRRVVEAHMDAECEFRSVECKHCGQSGLARDQEVHQHVCPMVPTACPNECGAPEMPRQDLRSHLQLECPAQSIACPLHGMGCHFVGSRAQMAAHMRDLDSNTTGDADDPSSSFSHVPLLCSSVLALQHTVRYQQQLIVAMYQTLYQRQPPQWTPPKASLPAGVVSAYWDPRRAAQHSQGAAVPHSQAEEEVKSNSLSAVPSVPSVPATGTSAVSAVSSDITLIDPFSLPDDSEVVDDRAEDDDVDPFALDDHKEAGADTTADEQTSFPIWGDDANLTAGADATQDDVHEQAFAPSTSAELAGNPFLSVSQQSDPQGTTSDRGSGPDEVKDVSLEPDLGVPPPSPPQPPSSSATSSSSAPAATASVSPSTPTKPAVVVHRPLVKQLSVASEVSQPGLLSADDRAQLQQMMDQGSPLEEDDDDTSSSDDEPGM